MRILAILFVACLCSAQTPHTTDGKPDFNGSWNIPYMPNMANEIGELPLTAEG